MAKGRMLNKSISLSMKFHLLPDDTCRLLATWLIPQLDKRGVFYGDAAVVKSLVLPMRADVTVEQVREYLKAMQHAGLIRIFEDGGRLWQVWPGFNHNQVGLRDDRETTDYATPPADAQDNNPKDDAGLTDEDQDTPGNLPEDIRQPSGEMTAEKNGNEMNEKEGGAANAAPVVYEAKDEDNMTLTPPPKRLDPLTHALDWMQANDKNIRVLRTHAKSETALEASIEFYRVSGINVIRAKDSLSGGAALYEACKGNLSLIKQAYDMLKANNVFVTNEWSLVKTCNVLASQPVVIKQPAEVFVPRGDDE